MIEIPTTPSPVEPDPADVLRQLAAADPRHLCRRERARFEVVDAPRRAAHRAMLRQSAADLLAREQADRKGGRPRAKPLRIVPARAARQRCACGAEKPARQAACDPCMATRPCKADGTHPAGPDRIGHTCRRCYNAAQAAVMQRRRGKPVRRCAECRAVLAAKNTSGAHCRRCMAKRRCQSCGEPMAGAKGLKHARCYKRDRRARRRAA